MGVFTFTILLSIIAPFFDMPALKKSGKVVYYSSLFIAEQPKNGRIKIHGGTLFDYFFVLDRSMNGKQRTNFIIRAYLSGLLSFLEENKDDKQLTVRGTTYILNERTIRKIGFKPVETDVLQKIILIYNYFNLLVSNSIAKNKLAFPRLNNIQTFETNIGHLLERKEYLERLYQSMKRNEHWR